MQLHDLKPSKGAHRRPDRIGRGTGSGRGKTSGRGQKGQNARSEGFRVGFEGGQMPLAQRIPKLPGFKNPFHRQFSVVNLSKLSRFPDGTKVDADALLEAGLVHQGMEIKVLGTGDLKRKLTVEAHFFSVSARAAIEKVGGSVKVLGEPRKIGPRRTAAKLPKPLPTTAEAAPAATPKAEKAEKPPKAERPAKQPREQGTPAETIEEATPPDEV
ncbi:MAG TPA: 50S ribosomal protein L15 [Candidatus Acidoferrum sp.]|nr:50S ribosomal protein L15 [Candidatus Acidoferrum sp.]